MARKKYEAVIAEWVVQSFDGGAELQRAARPNLPSVKISRIATIEGNPLFGNGQYAAVEVVVEQAENDIGRLSPRELEIARLLAAGYTGVNISALCGLSAHTVRTYIRRLYTKLGIYNRADLVRRIVAFSPAFDMQHADLPAGNSGSGLRAAGDGLRLAQKNGTRKRRGPVQ